MKRITTIEKWKDKQLFEMANITQDDTGLPVVVYISPKNANHGPRIKVQKDYSTNISTDFFAISIEDKPKVIGNIGKIQATDIELVIKWILLNKELLLDYWNQKENSTKKVLNNLKKII